MYRNDVGVIFVGGVNNQPEKYFLRQNWHMDHFTRNLRAMAYPFTFTTRYKTIVSLKVNIKEFVTIGLDPIKSSSTYFHLSYFPSP